MNMKNAHTLFLFLLFGGFFGLAFLHATGISFYVPALDFLNRPASVGDILVIFGIGIFVIDASVASAGNTQVDNMERMIEYLEKVIRQSQK
jgi:hypothetical protein